MNLGPIRRSTYHLIEVSRRNGHAAIEHDRDYIDWSIIACIEAINQNPDLVPTESCSGHDGHPFLALVFDSETAADRYLAPLKEAGYLVTNDIEELRQEFFAMNFPTVNVNAEWCIRVSENPISPEVASKLWKDCVHFLKGAP